jgi:hypothetical protein
MAEIWTLTEPQVLDIGGPDQQVRGVSIMVIGGQVDVLTHDDFPGVRLEVRGLSSDVPVTVHWNGSRLKIRHQLASSMAEGDVFEALQRVFDRLGGRASHSVDLSLSVPRGAQIDVATVSAPVLVDGSTAKVAVNTVSGEITLADLDGPVTLRTVSGSAWCSGLFGTFEANTVSGEVTVRSSELPRVTSRSVSGEVSLDLTSTPSRVAVSTVSGDLTLRVPALDGYRITGKGVSGQVIIGGDRHDLIRGQLLLSHGDEGLRVDVQSVSGRVVILQADPPIQTEPDRRVDLSK